MGQVEFDSLAELLNWLVAMGIDTTAWGQGKTKRPVDLWAEYQSGETSFQDDPPVRLVTLVQINIRRGERILIEVEQEFKDGRRRVRWRPPSEKLMRGEKPHIAALRCLREELGLEGDGVNPVEYGSITEEVAFSPSYPGLPTRYRIHTFETRASALPTEDFSIENSNPHDPICRHHWGWR